MRKRIEYQALCPLDMPKKERRKYNVGDVFENSARCNVCNEILYSVNRHDYNACKCGSSAVDGGSWYLKRHGDCTDRSIFYTDAKSPEEDFEC